MIANVKVVETAEVVERVKVGVGGKRCGISDDPRNSVKVVCPKPPKVKVVCPKVKVVCRPD